MPQIRMQDVHWVAARALKRGELPVTETGDNRHLRHSPRRVGGIANFPSLMMETLDGDLLVYDWKPREAVIGVLGIYVTLSGVSAVWLFKAGVWWSWLGFIMPAFGLLLSIWCLFGNRDRRLVIFDRRRGLVHLPRWFSRRYDAVRFADLTVLIVDAIVGVRWRRHLTYVDIAQPGRSLRRRGYPPWHRRIRLTSSFVDDDMAECNWRATTEFMTQPREAVGWAVRDSECQATTVELSYGGDWAAMRYNRQPRCRRLYGSELLTEPNWGYDAEGRWQRLPEGPRERVMLPDGPEDRRVPVTPRERAPRRWLRALWAGRS